MFYLIENKHTWFLEDKTKKQLHMYCKSVLAHKN